MVSRRALIGGAATLALIPPRAVRPVNSRRPLMPQRPSVIRRGR